MKKEKPYRPRCEYFAEAGESKPGEPRCAAPVTTVIHMMVHGEPDGWQLYNNRSRAASLVPAQKKKKKV